MFLFVVIIEFALLQIVDYTWDSTVISLSAAGIVFAINCWYAYTVDRLERKMKLAHELGADWREFDDLATAQGILDKESRSEFIDRKLLERGWNINRKNTRPTVNFGAIVSDPAQ
jgi:hypothetical protein